MNRETPRNSQKIKARRHKARVSDRKRETARNGKKDHALTANSIEFQDVAFLTSRSRSVKTPEVIAAYAPLIGWLNGEQRNHYNPAFRNTEASTLRIERLLKLIQSLAEGTSDEAKSPPRFPGKVHFRYDFSEYATVPYLQFDRTLAQWGLGRWPLGLPGLPGTTLSEEEVERLFRPKSKQPERSWIPFGEVMAAHGIFYLLACGHLARVRKCHCGRWYFKPQANSPACSDTCRKKNFDQTPEQRQKRKEKNRHNYLVRTGKINWERP